MIFEFSAPATKAELSSSIMLSEAETEKVESITNDIKPIRSQKSAEMHELGYDEPDVDLIILYIIAFMIVSFFMWLSVKLHC